MGPEPLFSQQAPRWCPRCWSLDLTLSTEDLELQSQIFVFNSSTPHTVCRSRIPHWGHSDGQVVYDFKTTVNQNLQLLGIKGHSQQSAKATYRMDENMCKLYTWKELISRIYKATSTNTHTNLILKCGKTWTDISTKKIYKWPKHMKKTLNITNHYENVTQNHNETPLHTH